MSSIDNKSNSEELLTREELEALTQRPVTITLGNYADVLATKTTMFVAYFWVITALGSLYIGSYFFGFLDQHLAFGWSDLREFHTLSKLRFIAGFLMLATLHVMLLLNLPLQTFLLCCFALLIYILVSGTSNLYKLDGAVNDPWFMAIYLSLQLVFCFLLLLLHKEERRSLKDQWRVTDR